MMSHSHSLVQCDAHCDHRIRKTKGTIHSQEVFSLLKILDPYEDSLGSSEIWFS